MHLTSSSIANGRIQKPHACHAQGGTDQSPQLTVENIPSNGKYVSIVIDDPDAMKPAGKVWVHWNVFNVPVTGRLILDAGQTPSGEMGITSGQGRSYEGPCPPDGEHTYRFAVFATSDKVKIDTDESWTLDAFEARYGSQVVAKAVMTGRFGP